MQEQSARLRGHVRVTGRSSWTYQGVYARLSNSGIWIPRVEPDSNQMVIDGPHFSIACLSSTFLTNAIYHTRRANLEYTFSGPFLGSIDSLTGYPAADMGTETFPIEQLALGVNFCPYETTFHFSGKCGGGLPWTFHYGEASDWAPEFEIAFSVGDADLPHFFDQAGSVEGFQQSRRDHIFSA